MLDVRVCFLLIVVVLVWNILLYKFGIDWYNIDVFVIFELICEFVDYEYEFSSVEVIEEKLLCIIVFVFFLFIFIVFVVDEIELIFLNKLVCCLIFLSF